MIPPPPPARPTRYQLLLRLIAPSAFLIAALALPATILLEGRSFPGEGLGPAAWPKFMLRLIAILAALWIVCEVVAAMYRLQNAQSTDNTDLEIYDYRKAVLAMVLIIAYCYALPIIGFPLATAIFITAVCILGELRQPLVVIPVSLIGTAALLWVFVGLALMPLSRGRGMFDEFSIAVLRGLGIY